MITAIIETRDDEVRLAHALATLVPAALEGAVREVIVIDYGSKDGTLTVADAAGCVVIRASNGDNSLRRVAEQARCEWLLILSPPTALAPGWQSDALNFIDRALVTGRARTSAATIRRGRVDHGWLSSVRRWLMPGEGRLVAKSAWLAATSSQPSAASSVSGARRGAA
jgi:glycosyltransferase involved in cell wall biosynthesis